MKNNHVHLSIVAPCYNEETSIEIFLSALSETMETTDKTYEVVFINDGSTDQTLDVMLRMKGQYSNLKIINLSRNFGKESALSAGLDHATGEAIVPIDVDLQDPPELIKQFIEQWENGFDVVTAKRVDRTTDDVSKKISANLFYKIHNRISLTKIPENVGDYRLITRKVLAAIQQLPENQRFMKGIFAWVGFKTTEVEYIRECRAAGNTSFNGWELWNLAMDGITSFSTIPLRVWLYIGVLISTISFIYGSLIIAKTVFLGIDVPGYASLLTVVLFLGGVQLMGIGLLGEYIGRIYFESKRRPIYIVESIY